MCIHLVLVASFHTMTFGHHGSACGIVHHTCYASASFDLDDLITGDEQS